MRFHFSSLLFANTSPLQLWSSPTRCAVGLHANQKKGAEGFALHGGPLDRHGDPDFFLTYHVHKDRIRTSLLAAAIQLSDVNAGDGGFCVLRGSHKANFPVPDSLVACPSPKDVRRLPVNTVPSGD